MSKKIVTLFSQNTIVKAAKSENIYIINIILKEQMKMNTFHKAIKTANEYHVINDLKELDILMNSIINRHPDVDVIVSFTDTNNGIQKATEYSDKYLHNTKTFNAESLKIANNKFSTRKFLDTKKLNNINFKIGQNKYDISTFFKQYGKCVVKDITGQGSKNVYIIQSLEQINLIPDNFRNFLIEEFIEGIEFSVEGIISGGKYHQIGVTMKTLIGDNKNNHNPIVEKGHLFPADIKPNVESSIYRLLYEFFENSGIKNSIVHSEVIIKNEKVFLVETHLRAGGDYIPKLIEYSTEINIYKLFFKSLYESLTTEDFKKKKCSSSRVEYLIPKIGKIKDYQINFNEIDTPYITKNYLTLKENMDITAITESFDRTCGCLIITHDFNSEEIMKRCLNNINLNYYGDD